MKKHLLFGASLVMLLAVSSFSGSAKADSTPIPLSGWAWSSNIGWISFNSTDSGTGTNGVGTSPIAYSVTISTSSPCSTTAACLNGYAWSSNIGWVSFNKSDLDSAPACPGGSAAAAIANLTTGVVTGWVRAYSGIGSSAWDGCIQLSDNGTTNLNCPISSVNSDNDLCHASPHTEGARGVTYYASPDGTQGFLNGYSWESGAVGWLDFGGSITGGGSYGVSFPLDGTTPPCTPGDPGCINNTIGVTCSLIPPTGLSSNGGTVSGQAIISNLPIGTYAYEVIDGDGTYSTPMVASNGTVPITSGSYNPNTSSSDATYGPVVAILDSRGNTVGSSPSACGVVTVAGSGSNVDSGMKLMIATPNVSLSGTDYDDTRTNNKTLSITKGQSFKLQWNVDPSAEYTSYTSQVSAGSWPAWGGLSSGSITVPTVGVPTGTYTFFEDNSNANVDSQSKATLIIKSSSEGEI